MTSETIKPVPIRQYRLFYKRPGATESFVPLTPGAHKSIYEVAPVQKAIQLIREHEFLEAVAVKHNGGIFNIVTFEQEAIAPNAFLLHPVEAI